MALLAEARRELRRALANIQKDVEDAIQDAVMGVYDAAAPKAPRLEAILYQRGRADGMAELWELLKEWAEPGEGNSAVPGE